MQQHCYFHKSEYIQHFCALKQCTLPLCQECLQIHEEQHKKKSEQPSIIPYRQAYQEVFGNLTLFIQNYKRPLQVLNNRVKKDKEEAIQIIENHFKDVQAQLDSQSKFVTEIEQKFEKLKKGSIKTIIYYYSGQISLKNLELPQFKQIQQSLKQFFRNLHEDKKQEIQTFRQKKNSEPEWSESKIQPYQPRQQSHSRKKSIFQNDKSKVISHKNNNEPYLENVLVMTEQEKTEPGPVPRNPYDNYQRSASAQEEEKPEVRNYFNNFKIEQAKKAGETNTYNGQMQNFKIQSKNLRNFEIESHLGLESDENSHRPLKEIPYAVNKQYRETRSRTLDKFPSMVDLKKGRENVSRLHNEQEFTRIEKPIYQQHRAGKWNRNHQEKDKHPNLDQTPSVFSQLTINETSNGFIRSTTEFQNRRPLKTTDLDTYTPSNNVPVSFEGRQRTASYEGSGLRTTMSHNNLYAAGKKTEPLIGDEFKKQVLSPHEIRRMLEKKIEERNKALSQKKELQLKINPDRSSQNMAIGSTARVGMQNCYREKVQLRDENTTWNQPEQKSSLYNTKDSIINHIYRETRY